MLNMLKQLLLTALTLFTLTSFAAEPADMKVDIQDNSVVLNWEAVDQAQSFVIQMAKETNASGELIYTTVEEIPATGDKFYSYDVYEVEAEGLVYFRIQQLDRWGENLQDVMGTANYLLKDHFTSNISPSPDYSKLYIDLQTTAASQAEIVVTTANGEQAYSGVFNAQKGWNSFDLPLDETMEDGMYIVTISCNEATQNQLIQKQAAPSFMVTVD